MTDNAVTAVDRQGVARILRGSLGSAWRVDTSAVTRYVVTG